MSDFEVWKDGGASKLVVGESSASVGGMPMENVAAWDGVSWKLLRPGAGGLVPPIDGLDGVHALKVHDTGSGPQHFAGGFFQFADDRPRITSHATVPAPLAGTPYYFGDGSLATACPCAPPSTMPNPSGAADSGCANSFHLDGTHLVATGATSLGTSRLLASGVPTAVFGFYIVGDAVVQAATATGDGVRCAGGAWIRLGSQNAFGQASSYPNPVAGWTIPLSTICGVVLGSDDRRHYQLFYRNAARNFCNPSNLNLSNAVAVIW